MVAVNAPLTAAFNSAVFGLTRQTLRYHPPNATRGPPAHAPGSFPANSSGNVYTAGTLTSIRLPTQCPATTANLTTSSTTTCRNQVRKPVATVVLVHGIAQEQLAAPVLESTLLPALAGGLANSGNPRPRPRSARRLQHRAPSSTTTRRSRSSHSALPASRPGLDRRDSRMCPPDRLML